MAFKYRQKKTIRRKRRFLKRKNAKTYRRSRKGIMSGGETWNVNVVYSTIPTPEELKQLTIKDGETSEEYAARICPLTSTPGTFNITNVNYDKTRIYGDLKITVPGSEETSIFQGGYFKRNSQNPTIYDSRSVMFISEKPTMLIDYFEKVELSTGTPIFPTSGSSLKTPLLTPSKRPWWSFSRAPKSPTDDGRL